MRSFSCVMNVQTALAGKSFGRSIRRETEPCLFVPGPGDRDERIRVSVSKEVNDMQMGVIMNGRVFLRLTVVAVGVRAEIIRVPGDYARTQSGINACSSGDTVLVSPGTYFGEGNVLLDYAGREILLIPENQPETTVVDCEYKDQTAGVVFRTSEGSGVRLSECSIKRGVSLGRRQGGGILCSGNVFPSIDACIVESCSALRMGGGICCDAGATPTIQDCRIESNRAVNAGGGVACVGNSHAIIVRCEMIEDSASAFGGGVATEGGAAAWIDNCNILDNEVKSLMGAWGGGVWCD